MAMDNKKDGVIVKNSTIRKKIDTQKDVYVDGELKIKEPDIKEPELNKELWKERMFKIHNQDLTLRYANPVGEGVHSENGYEIRSNGRTVKKIELEEGILVTLQEPVSILETHTGAGEAKEGDDLAGSVYLMSPTGEISFELSKIKGMEGMEAAGSIDADGNPTVNLGMFQMVMNFNADGKMAYGVEISAYLRDSLKVKTKNEDGTQNNVELVQGEYQKPIAGDGMLKFADSYVSTQKGKGNAPQITEIHFQERKKMENENASESNQTKESYYYKAFAAQEVRLKNAKDNSENISADSAKTKIFGFPVELNQVSINDSTGTMNAEKATLKWGNIALELKKIQLREKHKKVKRINTYKKSHDKDIKEILKISIMDWGSEKKDLKKEKGARTVIEEVDAEDGMGFESASLKLKNTEMELQNVSIKEEALEAGSASMQYNHNKLELFKTNLAKGSEVVEAETGKMEFESKQLDLSKVKMEDGLQAKLVTLNLGDGKTSLKEEKQVDVEIAENITAPIGQMELYQNKLSIQGVTLEKELKLSALTASAEIDNFFTIMTGFKYKEGEKATYNKGKVMTKLTAGEKDEEKLKEKQQFWLFELKEGEYTGTFQDKTESTGYVSTTNISKTTVEEGKITEEPSKAEKKEKVSEKRRNVLQRLKKMRAEKQKKKEKKAPKIKTKKETQEELKKDLYTLDGFAKIEDAAFDFIKEDGEAKVRGEGSVKFLDIPAIYYINDKRSKEKVAFAPEDAVEDVEFSIDSDGKLNAKFEDDAEVELNLKGVKKKENSGEGTTYAITLGDLSIENGYLKAGSASLERGLNLSQEAFDEENDPLNMSDKAKKFFECELTGSIVNEGEGEGVKLTKEGLKAHLGGNKFGKFGVSGFMGFLSGEVDFRGGEIAVSAEKSYEPEKLNDSFFSLSAETPEIEANIPTPIPGVGVEFSVTPSIGIGGAVGVGVKLGKAFDEWEKDSLEVDGTVEGEGHAGISVGAGVNVGAGYLASIDLKIEGGLTATLKGALEGSSAFAFNKDKNSQKKMRQSEDFTFDGSLGGKLEADVNVSSSAKFLFWKKQIFKFDLWKKELGKLEIKGKGKKSKDKKGLIQGWEITSGEFNAGWFSKEVKQRYDGMKNKGKKDAVISTEEFQNLVANCSEAAKDAWAVLCKLQAQRKDTAIILSQEDKEALDAQIESAKEEVKNKIDTYLIVLNTKKATLKNQLAEANTKLAEEKKKAEEYAKKQGLAENLFEMALMGGFDKDKYRHMDLPDKIEEKNYVGFDSDDRKVRKKALDEYNKAVKIRNDSVKTIEKYNAQQDANVAIDLMITYMLGKVSEQNLERINKKHMEKNKGLGIEEYVQKQIADTEAKLNAKLEGLSGDAKDQQELKNSIALRNLKNNLRNYSIEEYRSNTQFTEGVFEYYHQDNFYQMLNQKAEYVKRVDPNTRWMDDEAEGIKKYVFERKISDFPSEVQNFIEEKPHITMREILIKVREGQFSPTQKLQLIKKCFVGILPMAYRENMFRKTVKKELKSDHHMIQRGIEIKNGLFNHIGTLFTTIFKESEEKDDETNLLEQVVKGKNVFDIFQKMKELNQKVEDAADAVVAAQNNLKEIQNDITLVKSEITECNKKLETVKTKASEAVINKNFNADAAKNAIKIYSESYVEKMKGDNMQKSLEKIIEDKKVKENNPLPKSVGKTL